MNVSAEENREYSYTDKKAGYWYGTTHQEDLQWYSGWNMAKKRVLADYSLYVNGTALDRSEAECIVYPDRLVRRWDNATETFRMLDNLPIIYIGMEAVPWLWHSLSFAPCGAEGRAIRKWPSGSFGCEHAAPVCLCVNFY